MLCPMLAGVTFLWIHPDSHLSVWLCALGSWIHMPFSMMYHIQMARWQERMHPVDNPWRVFDQTFIHVAAAMWTFGLSGYIWYGDIVSALCALYIYWLWIDYFDVSNGRPAYPGKGGAPGRRHSILMMVFVYLLPPFLRGDYINAACALGFFILSAAVFVTYPFGGYSHSIFHVLLMPYYWFILRSAAEVTSISNEPPFHLSTTSPVAMNQIGLVVVITLCILVRHCAQYKKPS